MSHGGARVGAGRPRKNPTEPKKAKRATVPAEQTPIELKEGWVEPLDYMLAVINDPNADEGRKDRLAVAAAPYRHAKIEEKVGKKEQRQAAAEKAAETFAVPAAPRLVISNPR